jgi:hypothetical protein
MHVGYIRSMRLRGALPGQSPIGAVWPVTAILIAASFWITISPARAQTVIPVTDGTSLAAAIAEVDTDASASYIINFENAITLTGSADDILPALNTTSSVTIAGNGFTLNGGACSAASSFIPAMSQSIISQSAMQSLRAAQAARRLLVLAELVAAA